MLVGGGRALGEDASLALRKVLALEPAAPRRVAFTGSVLENIATVRDAMIAEIEREHPGAQVLPECRGPDGGRAVACPAEPAGSSVSEHACSASPDHASECTSRLRAASFGRRSERTRSARIPSRFFRPARGCGGQAKIAADHCAQMRELRERFDVSPLVIHASYLINVAAQSEASGRTRLLRFAVR